MSVEGKEFLKFEDMNNHPIWVFNENDELLYPVLKDEDFPHNNRNLFIRASFITANGINLNGYILGIKNIYAIAIFCNGITFYLNKNSVNSCINSINKLSQVLKKNIDPHEFSPLQYQTTIDLPGFRNIDGEFDIFKPRTDTERFDF